MAGSIIERLWSTRTGSTEHIQALRDDAHSEAQDAHRQGAIGSRRVWLRFARLHTILLKLIVENETSEREYASKAVSDESDESVETH